MLDRFFYHRTLKNQVFGLEKRIFSLNRAFRNVDPMLVPTWLHFGSQNPAKSIPKSIPRGINKIIDFWINIGTILAPFWEPTWGHVGAQDGPRAAQEPPKRHPRGVQEAPGTRLGARSRPRGAQTSSRPHFWIMLVMFLGHF